MSVECPVDELGSAKASPATSALAGVGARHISVFDFVIAIHNAHNTYLGRVPVLVGAFFATPSPDDRDYLALLLGSQQRAKHSM
jgi:hypothetical protein